MSIEYDIMFTVFLCIPESTVMASYRLFELSLFLELTQKVFHVALLLI